MNPEVLVSILLDLLAKSALILAAAALIDAAWLRASAAQRHLVWCAALFTVLLLPLTRLHAPPWAVPLQRVRVELPRQARTDLPPVETAAASAATITAMPKEFRWRLPDWKHAVLWTWSIGAGLLLGVRLLGSLSLARLRRTTHPLTDARAQQRAAEVIRDLGIRRHVELRLSPAGCVPLTWGSLRPVLILPSEALAWNDAALTAALRHEAGHIARGDHLTRWLAQFACILYWPNPLVWLAARRLRAAQEEATDDLVLRSGTAPAEYAAQLFHVARSLVAQHEQHAVAMANPSTLERRMHAIVDEHRDRRPLSRRALLSGMFAVVVTLALSTAAQLQAQEKKAPGERTPAPRKVPQIMIESKFVEISEEAQVGLKFFVEDPESDAIQGALALSGVLAEAEFAKLIGELDQQRGVDLLSAPRVTTRSEQRATIEIIREFRYPSEYEKEGDGWKPTAFETRNTGITLDVLAAATADGKLDLELAPSVVEFLGFIDLDGGAKYPANSRPDASPAERIDATAGVPAGRRARPVFFERKINTTVSVWSGQTVLLGTVGKPSGNKDFPTKSPARRLAVFITASIVKGTPQAPGTPDFIDDLILPRVDFKDVKLSEAVAFLQTKAAEAGAPSVKIIVSKPPTPEPVITLPMTNVPLGEAVRSTAEIAGLKVRRDANTFVLEAKAPASDSEPVPLAQWVPGKPGFVTSPHATATGYVDVRGFKPGTKLRCPYTGQLFAVPEAR